MNEKDECSLANLTVALFPRDKEAAELFYFALRAGGKPVFENPQGALVHLRFVVDELPSFSHNETSDASFSDGCENNAIRMSSESIYCEKGKDDGSANEHKKMSEDRFLEVELIESIRLWGWMEEVGGNTNNALRSSRISDDEENGGDGDGEEVLQVLEAKEEQKQMKSLKRKRRQESHFFPHFTASEKQEKNEAHLAVVGNVPLRLHVSCAAGQSSLSTLLENQKKMKEHYNRFAASKIKELEDGRTRHNDVILGSTGSPSTDFGDTEKEGKEHVFSVSSSCLQPNPSSGIPPLSCSSAEEKKLAAPATSSLEVHHPVPSACAAAVNAANMNENPMEEMHQSFLYSRNDTPYIRNATEALITYANVLAAHPEIVGEDVFEEKENENSGVEGAVHHLVQFHTTSDLE